MALKATGVFTAVSNADHVAGGMLRTSMKRPAGRRRSAQYSHDAKNDRVSSWPGSR
jgi:hypothetical protein